MSRVPAKAGRACSTGKACRLPAAGGGGQRPTVGKSASPSSSGPRAASRTTPSSTRKSASSLTDKSAHAPSRANNAAHASPRADKAGRPSSKQRTESSRRWLKEHFEDPYVQAAWKEGYRSRAAFKLLELQEKYKLIRPGAVVLDLGAAPGGWTQVTARILAGKGRVVALDILAMDPIAGAEILRGDFLEASAPDQLRTSLAGGADVVLSDMAPNMSGIRSADQDRGAMLAEEAMRFAIQVLNPGGALVLKLFHGPEFHTLVKEAKRYFTSVKVVKPEASRDRSSEQYLVATGFRPPAPTTTDDATNASDPPPLPV